MFRLLTTIVCLLAAGSVFGQAHSASYTKDYQREAHDIFDDIIGMRTAAERLRLDMTRFTGAS